MLKKKTTLRKIETKPKALEPAVKNEGIQIILLIQQKAGMEKKEE